MSETVQALKINLETNNSTLIISMDGKIEDQFSKFVLQLSSVIHKFQEVEINMDKITFINSPGIREWIRLMVLLKNMKTAISFCPPLIVNQINLVEGFVNKNTVMKSFYVSYYNEEKDIEKKILYVSGKDYATDFLNIKEHVEEDGNIFKLDVIKIKYFNFLGKKTNV